MATQSAFALAAVAAFAAACRSGPLPSDESAVLLRLTAYDDAITPIGMTLLLSDDDGATEVHEFQDIADWPRDPSEHTILLVVDTPDRGTRVVDIVVAACAYTTACAEDLGSIYTLASATITGLTFTGGELLEDEALLLE